MMKTLAIVAAAAAGSYFAADYVKGPLGKLVKADTPTAERIVGASTVVGLTVAGTALGLALFK